MDVACSSKKENWDSELSMGWWNWELTCRSLERAVVLDKGW